MSHQHDFGKVRDAWLFKRVFHDKNDAHGINKLHSTLRFHPALILSSKSIMFYLSVAIKFSSSIILFFKIVISLM